MSSITADISALTSKQAIRALALTADHDTPLPDPAQLRALDDGLRQAIADSTELAIYADPSDHDAGPGDLARVTLLHLVVTRPDLIPVITRAIEMPTDGTRFEPTILAIGALVVLVLQTEVKLARSTKGEWSFTVHKHSVRDSTLGQVITKLIGLYKPGGA